MPQELPKLGDLFFVVCRTAIQNTSWKYSEFERIKFVEGQLDALENYFKQPVEDQPVDEGVGIELPIVSTIPKKLTPAGQGEAKAPEADKVINPEPEALKTAPVASEQEKKN